MAIPASRTLWQAEAEQARVPTSPNARRMNPTMGIVVPESAAPGNRRSHFRAAMIRSGGRAIVSRPRGIANSLYSLSQRHFTPTVKFLPRAGKPRLSS
jgi:hypothetical protein